MKLFILKDLKANAFVDAYLSENQETAIRRVRVQLDNFLQSKNYGAITMLKDCELLEVSDFNLSKVIGVADMIKTDDANQKVSG